MIERIRGQARGRNRASAYKDLVWTVATAGDTSADIAGQTRQALATIEQSLTSLGASKQRIVSTQIFLARMAEKAATPLASSNALANARKSRPLSSRSLVMSPSRYDCAGVRLLTSVCRFATSVK